MSYNAKDAASQDLNHNVGVRKMKEEKSKPGASWKANEEHVLPENRLSLVRIQY